MILGVLSDTHDQFARTRRAVETLLRNGAGAIVHCGDLCSQPILDLLAGDVPAYFVFGNNDWDREGLRRDGEQLGLVCLETGGVIELGGKRIGVAHGDVTSVVRKLATDEGGVTYLLSGHTHVAADEQVGVTRWVNPGALHRTRSPSVCTIDLARDAVKFLGVV